MFLGAIDGNLRRYIVGNKDAFAGQPVVVGCSGNFTIEKVISQATTPGAIHSNDVSLYTLLLADAMLGQHTPLTVKEPEYNWLGEYLDAPDPWVRPVTVMLTMNLLKFEKRKSIYAKRMWSNGRANFGQAVADSAARMPERATSIASYTSGDVLEHFKQHSAEDAIFMSFLPFYKGGYESLYKRLQQVIGWPEPTYKIIDDKYKQEIIDWLEEPGRRYLHILDHPLPGREAQLVSHSQQNTWVHLYSNVVERTGLFRRKVADSGKRFVLVAPDYAFTPATKIGIAKIKSADVAHYKSLFLARNIDFVSGMFGFALLADEQVIGFSEMSLAKYAVSDEAYWYMLSDFAVEPKPHKLTSKLILGLVLSNEMRRVLEHSNLRNTIGVYTTAFTDKPVSMKYRGVFKLQKRGKNARGNYLNYSAEWSGLSAQETYNEWYKKHAKS